LGWGVFFFLSFLLVFPVWMRGGTRPELLGPVLWLSLGAVLAMLAYPGLRQGETLARARMRVVHDFFSDPVLYAGVAFLFLLWLQWLNGPRPMVFDEELQKWVFGPAPKAGLPLFCIDRDEAFEMLLWFVPLYAIVLVIRNGFARTQKMELLRLLVANAGLVAVFGVVQFLSGSHRIYGVTPLKVHFFAAFGYQNHAGAYFVLSGVLTAGLLLRSFLKKDEREERLWLICGLAVIVMAGLFCKSRTAIGMIAVLSAAGVLYGFKRLKARFSLQGRAGVLVCLALFLGVAVYAFWVVPGNLVREELERTTTEEVALRVGIEEAPARAAAWRIWQDHPWFGTGGWGFRRFLPLYMPPPAGSAYSPGAANVHMDPLQFLTEFGAVGAGILLGTVLLMVWPIREKLAEFRKPDSQDRPWLMRVPPLGLALVAGPLLTVIHSMFDLPFRSPAIFWMWAALLACAPACWEGNHGSRRKIDWVTELGNADSD
jgi:hypothetical protein